MYSNLLYDIIVYTTCKKIIPLDSQTYKQKDSGHIYIHKYTNKNICDQIMIVRYLTNESNTQISSWNVPQHILASVYMTRDSLESL